MFLITVCLDLWNQSYQLTIVLLSFHFLAIPSPHHQNLWSFIFFVLLTFSHSCYHLDPTFFFQDQPRYLGHHSYLLSSDLNSFARLVLLCSAPKSKTKQSSVVSTWPSTVYGLYTCFSELDWRENTDSLRLMPLYINYLQTPLSLQCCLKFF